MNGNKPLCIKLIAINTPTKSTIKNNISNIFVFLRRLFDFQIINWFNFLYNQNCMQYQIKKSVDRQHKSEVSLQYTRFFLVSETSTANQSRASGLTWIGQPKLLVEDFGFFQI